MMKDVSGGKLLGAAVVLAACLSGGPLAAQGNTAAPDQPVMSGADALRQVSEAARVVDRLREVTGMPGFLQQAHGLFVVPSYARAALGVGARAGEGILVANRDGRWTDPVFYNLGGVSLGLQAGVKTGDLVFILNNEKALDSFRQQDNWSLNAEAGFTVVGWSEKAQAGVGKGDVTVWDSTGGLFGNLAVSLTNISLDEDDMADYYGRMASVDEILSGATTHVRSAVLKRALTLPPEQVATPGDAGEVTEGGSN